jgi:hypothetical protein
LYFQIHVADEFQQLHTDALPSFPGQWLRSFVYMHAYVHTFIHMYIHV